MIYKIFEFENSEQNNYNYVKSFIAISAKPHGGVALEQEIIKYKNFGIDIIVSLLTPEEAEAAGLAQEHSLCNRHKIGFLSYPIPDMGVAENIADFKKIILSTLKFLQLGKSVMVHCYGGLGRSGTFVACLLKQFFATSNELISFISTKRDAKIPETKSQFEFIDNFSL